MISEILIQKVNDLKARRAAHEAQRRIQIREVCIKYFGRVMNPILVDVYTTCVEFGTNYNYGLKSVFTLNLEKDWNAGSWNGLSISSGSPASGRTDELIRLQAVGKAAKILLEDYYDILRALNNAVSSDDLFILAIDPEIRDLEQAVARVQVEEDEIRVRNFMKDLREGIRFSELQTIKLTHKPEFSYIRGLKIVKEGKQSVQLLIEYDFTDVVRDPSLLNSGVRTRTYLIRISRLAEWRLSNKEVNYFMFIPESNLINSNDESI
jgi:hypothetical protein